MGEKDEEKEGGMMLMCRGENILVEKYFDEEKYHSEIALQSNADQ